MDGVDFARARERHRTAPSETAVRHALTQLSQSGVSYFRDGGDGLGVSLLARQLAGEYGIEYATPAFAIHRRGRYGSIVGKSYATAGEFTALAEEVLHAGGDFIKLMFSGILTFDAMQPVSCPPLDEEEIRWLVTAAHGMGLKVMAHVNGAAAVLAAARAGTDSIEHGYFADDACLEAMAANGCIWVPTLAAVEAFSGREGFHGPTVDAILHQQLRQVNKAASAGVPIASGSDAGAAGVFHGAGICRELALLDRAGVKKGSVARANEALRRRFRR